MSAGVPGVNNYEFKTLKLL